MPHLIQPELLESYKLETKFYKNHVSHVTFSTDLGGTTRKRLRQEVKWDNEREIGKGSFGHVRLQQRRSPCNDNEVTVRAVKVIDKQAMRRHKIVYRREIEAMAALDASQVSRSLKDIPLVNQIPNSSMHLSSSAMFPILRRYLSLSFSFALPKNRGSLRKRTNVCHSLNIKICS